MVNFKTTKAHMIHALWFIAAIVISALAALKIIPLDANTIWIILGISGVGIAVLNIQVKEEVTYLVGVTALVIIIAAFILIPDTTGLLSSNDFKSFLINLLVVFGFSGLIVGLALISKIGLEY
jgi:hypothetical protein